MKKSVQIFILLLVFCVMEVSALFGQQEVKPDAENDLTPVSASALSANRRTAVRYLQLAKQYAADKEWAEADSQAALGLAYDDSIADLWYIRAAAQTGLHAPKAQVLPLVTTALTEGQWVDYNRDGARILYADILCSTEKFDMALSVLDTQPMLYSADAEYIRAKCFYNLKTPENVDKARSKIDAARKIYPNDVRFALLFFKYEYAIEKKNEAAKIAGADIKSDAKNNGADVKADAVRSPLVKKIAGAFITQLPNFRNADPELEMYASLFADGDNKIRMLKSFNARGLKDPHYAATALTAGLIDQEGALDYFLPFADKKIDYDVLMSFIPLITEEQPKKELGEYLTAYNGVIAQDTDGDLAPNLVVSYNRGRPAQVAYDKDEDDENEWTATCDFGVPETVQLTEGMLTIKYGTWPSVEQAVYMSKDMPALTFSLVAESLVWTPFTVEPNQLVKDDVGTDFFTAVLPPQEQTVSAEELIRAASSYELPSEERPHAVITVSMLDGVPQIARYSVNGVMYAQTQFEKGLPVLRNVDEDGDGLFETTETYGYYPDHNQKVQSKSDESQIMTNLFGSPATGSGIYVRMIQIDSNGDTIPDFTEEYTENGGKISSWDSDADGLWDTRYIKYAPAKNGSLKEDAQFHQPLSGSVVTITSVNGVPVAVSDGGKAQSVTKDAVSGLYWLGKAGSAAEAQKIIEHVNQSTTQGVCSIVESGTERMLAVRIGKMIIGEILPEKQTVETEKK